MKWVRLSARLIATLWAGFWVLFVVGSVIDGFTTYSSQPGSDKIKGLIVGTSMLVVFLGSLYLAWRRPFAAGIWLVLIGLVAVWFSLRNSHHAHSTLFILALPPFVSGALFLLSRPRR
jgi:uncharacterized membrane protein YccC